MDILYTASMQAIQDVTYALNSAGYQTSLFSPNNPKIVTDTWVKARQLYSNDIIEAGNPLDYRAIVKSARGEELFLHIEENHVLQIPHEGDLQVFEPQKIGKPTGISLWQNPTTGQTMEVFSWDGSELQFSGVLSFFQLKGNTLNQLEPVLGADGQPSLQGTATLIESGYVYNFTMTKDSGFFKNEVGGISTVSLADLKKSARQIG